MKHSISQKHLKRQTAYSFIIGFVMLISSPFQATYAAPGTLSDVPLFLSNGAQPNVFFMIDDSGSMDAETMTDEAQPASGCNGCHGFIVLTSDASYTWHMFISHSTDNLLTQAQYVVPTQAAADVSNAAAYLDGVWRARNNDYNSLYYDPTVTYLPWPGLNNNNQVFLDAPLTCAPNDPHNYDFSTSSGPCTNLTQVRNTANGNPVTFSAPCSTTGGDAGCGAANDYRTIDDGVAADDDHTMYYPRYWVWRDINTAPVLNANGVTDADDDHFLVEITNGLTVCTNGTSATVDAQFTYWAANANTPCLLRSYTEEIQNFANWWSYHRRRELTAKAAIGQVIDNITGMRVGFGTINGSGQRQNASISGSSTTNGTNKEQLLDNIYDIQSSGGTPLRGGLVEAGNYFACSGTTPFGNAVCGLDTSLTAPGGYAITEPAGTCSQNFTVLIADGDYNDQTGNYPPVNGAVSNSDNDASSSSYTDHLDDGGSNGDVPFSFDGAPYASATDDSLADIAMYYYERDLNSTLNNKVPKACGVDENPGQHMVTYTVNFGVQGALDPTTLPVHPRRGYADTACVSDLPGTAFAGWPTNVAGSSADRLDDMIHAAYNGRGEYISAENANALSNSLSQAITSIAKRLGSASAVTFNSSTLNTNTRLYQARFNSTTWGGELYSFTVANDGSIGTTSTWGTNQGAQELLDARNLTTSPRAIVTYDPTIAPSGAGTQFTWATLTAAQQNDLKTLPNGTLDGTGTADSDAQLRLDYIRGDRTCETSTCNIRVRNRIGGRLGDIVHSDPTYVGTAVQNYPEGNGVPFGDYSTSDTYSRFKQGNQITNYSFTSTETAATRTPMLYVGANDGMLHAFNANNGEEIWAYIPNSLFADTTSDAGIHRLTDPNYTHKYFVDMPTVVSDAYIRTPQDVNKKWRTILVGGLRGGGRGLFAIDVTDPDYIINATGSVRETRAAANIMWEFQGNASDTLGDEHLGFTYSEAAIVPLRLNNNPNDDADIEWFVVVGNGYENPNTSGTNPYAAKLYLIKLAGPDDGTWTEGTDFFIIDTNAGAVGDRNGLSSPALADIDGDGLADWAYAGDVQGNLWAFDFTKNTPGTVDIEYGTGANPEPLFIAQDSSANRQPITSKPVLGLNTSVAAPSNQNIMVYFGTGSYVASSDINPPYLEQSFYGIWDDGDNTFGVGPGATLTVADHSNGATGQPLIRQAIDGTLSTTDLRVTTNNIVDYSVTDVFGWFMDLPDTGERVVVNTKIRGGTLFFNTVVPSIEPCDPGGDGWLMSLNAVTGQRPGDAVFDANNDGMITIADLVSGTDVPSGQRFGSIQTPGGTETSQGAPGESSFIEDIQCTPGSDGVVTCRKVEPDETDHTGRFSWRELDFN